MASYINYEDYKAITGTNLSASDAVRFGFLSEQVSDYLRQLFVNQFRDLDEEIKEGKILFSVIQNIAANVLLRIFKTGSSNYPDAPAGEDGQYFTAYEIGVFIKTTELQLLKLKKQKIISKDKDEEEVDHD